MDRAIAANQRTGCTPSHAPAVSSMRRNTAKAMSESDAHLSKKITGHSQALCSKCGEPITVMTWAAVTNACRIRCSACKLNDEKKYTKDWAKRNP